MAKALEAIDVSGAADQPTTARLVVATQAVAWAALAVYGRLGELSMTLDRMRRDEMDRHR
jgi:hypothetical protein